MRTILAAAALGAAVLSPFASPASASCIALTEDPYQICVSPPCPAGTVNSLDEKLGDHLNEWACLA